MPNIKFTSTSIQRLLAPTKSGKPQIFWDQALSGFGILCSGKTALKTYIAQRSVGVGVGAKRRIKLAHVDAISLDEARALAHQQLHLLLSGVDPREERKKNRAERQRSERQDISLAEATRLYFAQRQNVSDTIRRCWPRLLEQYVPELLPLRLRDVTPTLVEEKRTAIAAAVAKRTAGKRPVNFVTAPGTAQAGIVARVIRTIYNSHAKRLGWPRLSLYTEPERGRITRRTRTVPSEAMPAFWRAVSELKNRRDETLVKVLLLTGLRRDEAASLRWENIKFADRMLEIPPERTKSKRALRLPLTGPLMTVLMQWRAQGITTSDFVFPAYRQRQRATGGTTQYISDTTNAFRAIEAATGLTLSPHDLRRTFATVAESIGVPLLALKILLNHAVGNSDVTLGYIVPEWIHLRAAAEKIATRIMELAEAEPLPETVTKLSGVR